MLKNVRSTLEEIESYIPAKHVEKIIESRAANIIDAAINIINLIEKEYSQEEAENLTKKFLLSIKNKENKKFINKLKMLNESRKRKKTI